MSTIGNFFENVARRGKELGDQGVDRMKSALGGLRGQGTVPPRPDRYNFDGNYSRGEPGFQEPSPMSAANPNVGPDGTAEAQSYQAERAAFKAQNPNFGQPTTPAEPTGLRAGLRTLERAPGAKIGAAGAALNEGISLTGALANGDFNTGTGAMKAVGRSALRGGMTVLGGAAGGALGSIAGPVGTFAGAGAGAYGGAKLGDAASDALFGPEAKAAPVQAAAPSPQQPQSEVMTGSSSPDGEFLNGKRMIPTTDGGRADAPSAMGLRGVGPTAGYGVVQRTDEPGHAPVAIGGPDAVARDAATARANSDAAQAKNAYTAAGRGTAPNGVFGEIANMQGLRTQVQSNAARDSASREGLRLASTTRGQDITREGQQLTAASATAARNLEIARLGHQLGNENEKKVGERTAEYASSKVPVLEQGSVMDRNAIANRDAQVKAKTNEVNELIKHSLSDRKDGKSTASLSPAEHSQLLLANDIREKVVDSRGGIVQKFRDYFGNKEFDSRNLYSYLPTKAEPAANGGYKITFGNGNTVTARDVVGGQFSLTGPNGPIDADLMSVMRPVIQEYLKTHGGK